MQRPDIQHVIDGQTCPSRDGRTFDTVNPATRTAWASVALGGDHDVELAVQAARRAFDDGPWPRFSNQTRARALHRLADLVEQHADDLGRLDTTDMGKPLAHTTTRDVPRAAENFRFWGDYACFAHDEAFPSPTGHHVYTRAEPVGVAAAISPWNFPLQMASWKVAPALAFGNTVVLKPAEQSPASCARLAELALEAEIPPGVFNVVHGFGPSGAGEALTRSPAVDLVTFTGESATGRQIMAAAAPTLKRVSFELGGKGANLVFADADLDSAVDWSVKAAFTNAGQVCLAGSRVSVERPVFDAFVDRFVAAAESLPVGDPLDPATEIGPLSSEEHYLKVTAHLDAAEATGAKLLTGGRGDGWTVRPTVIVDAPRDAPICREEVFGPVVTVDPFDGDDEAVAAANDTPYGLSALVFTENLRRAHRVAGALRAGSVWVNCFFVREPRAPVGGFKASGIGREGGRHSRDFFTEAKAVIVET